MTIKHTETSDTKNGKLITACVKYRNNIYNVNCYKDKSVVMWGAMINARGAAKKINKMYVQDAPKWVQNVFNQV